MNVYDITLSRGDLIITVTVEMDPENPPARVVEAVDHEGTPHIDLTPEEIASALTQALVNVQSDEDYLKEVL